MAHYRVVRHNPYFPVGTFLTDSDMGCVQKTHLLPDGAWGGHEGLLIPLSEIRQYTIRIQKYGLDKNKGGAYV
jgi:hypothetical protein